MVKPAREPSVLQALDTLAEIDPIDLRHSNRRAVAEAKDRDENPSPDSGSESARRDSLVRSRFLERGPIGMGGLGEVVEAFDVDLRRTVAIKRLKEGRDTKDNIARLIQEAQVTAQLEHPSIPPVYNLGLDDEDRPFFAMTRVSGISLGDLLRNLAEDPELDAQYGLSRMLRIFHQVAYALAFAHDRGVVHRDIKPDNVMLGEFGEVRLMDWGIAKVIGQPDRVILERSDHADIETTGDKPESRFGVIVGTPGYMSPEQIAGEEAIDGRSDIYGLGVMIYEMLSGALPTGHGDTMTLLQRTLDGDLIPVQEVANVPPAVCGIIAKALETDREERYQSILELVRDVEAFLEGKAVRAASESLLHRAGRLYLSRTPRSSRLRFIDVDTLAASSTLIGAAIGIWAAPLLGPVWGWVLLILGVLLGIPFYYTWVRKPRASDPNALPFPGDPKLAQHVRTTRPVNQPPEPDDTAELGPK